jgi:hypothetical protein
VIRTAIDAVAGHIHGVSAAVVSQAVRHGHKQGGVAVVISVLGLAALVVAVVLLGSLSARRRMRDKPPDQDIGRGDLGRGGRGMFG